MNPSRVRLQQFAQRAAESAATGALVLDAGAGHGPYRSLFDHCRYEAADFERVPGKTYNGNDYICDLTQIPVEDHRYSVVLLSQVLEHLPEPVRVLTEMRRVLKPGGTIWASTPLFYEEHDTPYDFYRYTQYGLVHIFEQAGFQVREIDWLEGYLATVGYQLGVAARASKQPLRWGLWKAAGLANRGELRRKVTGVGHPKNYTIIAG